MNRIASSALDVQAGPADKGPGPATGLWVIIGVGLALSFCYFALYGFTAWHPTDYEYVMACAWRVAKGEVPYRDFIYHKPLLTPFLHTVWLLLPGPLQVPVPRLFFYLQMVASGFLPVAWALHRGRVPFGWRLPLLSATFTIFAIHNFPAMPWQTSDGILFTVVGLVALVESLLPGRSPKLAARACASASFTLALLSKQSFFFGGLLLLLLALWELGLAIVRWRRGSGLRGPVLLLVSSAAPALLLLGASYGYLEVTGALPHFLAQLRSQSSESALRSRGYDLYRSSPFLWTIPAWGLLPLLRRLCAQRGWRFFTGRLLQLGVLMIIAYLARIWPDQPFIAQGQLLFFIVLGTFLGRLLLPLGDPLLLCLHLGFVLLGWSCQLSLGYASPILGVAGLGLVFHELFPRERSVPLDVAPVLLLTGVVALTFLRVNEKRPYRDAPRSSLRADLGQVSPRLAGIKTSPGTLARYVELHRLILQHAIGPGRPFAVLEDYPGIHWLLSQKNAIGIDWVYPPEPDGFEERLWDELLNSGAIAIIPKEVKAPWDGRGAGRPCADLDFQHHNLLSQKVVAHFRLLHAGTYFCAYGPPSHGGVTR